MTGNNLTYALIPRLSRWVSYPTGRLARSLARSPRLFDYFRRRMGNRTRLRFREDPQVRASSVVTTDIYTYTLVSCAG